MDGQIQLGTIDLIDSVLWFSDISDFTGQSEALAPQELVDRLNQHFGRLGAAIDAHGGEILKFLGDGVLAVFPVDNPRSRDVGGARRAEGRRERGRAWPPEPSPSASASMSASVIYGNVGAENRLDFTVLGAAVNLTSRLSSLCRPLDRPLLVSDAYAALVDEPMQSLGAHRLKGVAEPVSVFEPASK